MSQPKPLSKEKTAEARAARPPPYPEIVNAIMGHGHTRRRNPNPPPAEEEAE